MSVIELESLEKAALNGDVDAIFQLGLKYWEKFGEDLESGAANKADFRKAMGLIREAKRKEHELADMYYAIICAFEETGLSD